MRDDEWDALSTEEQEAHIKRELDRARRVQNRCVLEMLRFVEAAAAGKLVEMRIEAAGIGAPSAAATLVATAILEKTGA